MAAHCLVPFQLFALKISANICWDALGGISVREACSFWGGGVRASTSIGAAVSAPHGHLKGCSVSPLLFLFMTSELE